jgi:hypothetical protein
MGVTVGEPLYAFELYSEAAHNAVFCSAVSMAGNGIWLNREREAQKLISCRSSCPRIAAICSAETSGGAGKVITNTLPPRGPD